MQLENRPQGHAFSGPGFANQRHHFTASNLEVDAVNRADRFSARREGDIQVFDVHQDVFVRLSIHVQPHAVAVSVTDLMW